MRLGGARRNAARRADGGRESHVGAGVDLQLGDGDDRAHVPVHQLPDDLFLTAALAATEFASDALGTRAMRRERDGPFLETSGV